MRRFLTIASYADMVLTWFGYPLPIALGVVAGLLWSGAASERSLVGVAIAATSLGIMKAFRILGRRSVRVQVRPRFDDLGGPFLVVSDDGYVEWAHSLHTNLEFTNTGDRRLTAERAYLEFMMPRPRFLRRRSRLGLVDAIWKPWVPGGWVVVTEAPAITAAPPGSGGPLAKINDARIDVVLEPGFPSTTITVEFNREWAKGSREAPTGPGVFDARVRIEFTDGRRPEFIPYSPKPTKSGS